jgi:hypothetical protein
MLFHCPQGRRVTVGYGYYSLAPEPDMSRHLVGESHAGSALNAAGRRVGGTHPLTALASGCEPETLEDCCVDTGGLTQARRQGNISGGCFQL